MTGLRALLFDLDDTLYPEAEFVLSGFRAVARWAWDTFGISEESGYCRLREMFNSGIRGRTFNLWLEEQNLADLEYINSAIKIYREHLPVICTFPEVPELLKRLQRRYLLGIVTDGDWRIQDRKIAALGISNFFSIKILTDTLGSDFAKPSRRPFIVALERLGVAAESACYVGDNVMKDFLGARQTGLKTIQIRMNDGIYNGVQPPTPDHSPDYVIDSLTKLEDLLAVL